MKNKYLTFTFIAAVFTAVFIFTLWSNTMAEENQSVATGEPQVKLNYLYAYANDIEAMRKFYTELVGMNEGSYRNDEQWGWLTYKCGDFELMFFRFETPVPAETRWASQPGWDDGTIENVAFVVSWSIFVPFDRFTETVKRLKDAGVVCYYPKPQWLQDSYWGFPVKDPMGNTVEIYTEGHKDAVWD